MLLPSDVLDDTGSVCYLRADAGVCKAAFPRWSYNPSTGKFRVCARACVCVCLCARARVCMFVRACVLFRLSYDFLNLIRRDFHVLLKS